jgi:hypothetical protein
VTAQLQAWRARSRPNRPDVFLLGFPAAGIPPAALRRTFAGPEGNLLLLDLPAGEGFSGAPMLRQGKVVGIVTDEDPRFTYATDALVARNAVNGWGVVLGDATSPKPPGGAGPPQPKGAGAGSSRKAAAPPPAGHPCLGGERRTEAGVEYVHVCAAAFTLGFAPDSKAQDVSKPAHRVTLSEYWISRSPITYGQYYTAHPNYLAYWDAAKPATSGVDWYDAESVCAYFGGRLPSEAQLEYVVRANLVNSTPETLLEWTGDIYAPFSGAAHTDPSGPPEGDMRVTFQAPLVLNDTSYLQRIPRSPTGWWRFMSELGFRCVLGRRRDS